MKASHIQDWIRISWKGVDWLVAEGYEYYIPAGIWESINHPEDDPQAHIIKKNILRTSLIVPLPGTSGDTVFVKRHHPRHWKDDLRNLLLPSRAFNEWKTLLQFKALHIPAPTPLAYGEKRSHGILKDSFLITNVLDSADPLSATFLSSLDSLGPQERFFRRTEIIAALAPFIARLHNAGVYFRDLHGGNILLRKRSGHAVELVFVDTDKAWFSPHLNLKRRVSDLATLYNALFIGATSSWIRFLKAYGQETERLPVSWEEMPQQILPVARAYQARHLKSRSKRCLKRSTSFRIFTEGKSKLFFHRDVSLSIVRAAVSQARERRAQLSSSQLCLECQVTVPSSAPPTSQALLVAYYPFSWEQMVLSIIGRSSARRAWVNANALVVRNIPTLQPLALVERKMILGIKQSYLITEAPAGRQTLSQYVMTHFLVPGPQHAFPQYRRFMKEFAETLCQLYRKKIFISDLSGTNVLVRPVEENSWCFYFPYQNNISFDHTIPMQKIKQNLLNLHRSLVPGVGWRARIRFLYYLFRSSLPKERKIVIHQLVQQASRFEQPPS